MKVLHVIESLGRGGAEQLIATLAPELQRLGVEVVVALRGGAEDLRPVLEAEGITVHVLRKRHRWNLIGFARDLARLVSREQVQIVHAHLYFPAVGTALMRILGLSRACTCVTFHNLAYAGANSGKPGLVFRRRLAAFVYPRGIDLCLAVSEAVAVHYLQALGLRAVAVVPNPVDVAALSAIAANNVDFDLARPTQIILPGRLVHEKGHADLFDALIILSRRRAPPLMTTVAGDGPLRKSLTNLARTLGLDKQVRFIGAQDHGDLMRLMAASDIVVVPSRFEGFGLTALEAMALGRPVIASAAGGLPEVLGHAGVTVPVADPVALADAIAALAGDPGRRAALGTAASQRAAANFDLSAVAARLVAAYGTLLSPQTAATEGRS